MTVSNLKGTLSATITSSIPKCFKATKHPSPIVPAPYMIAFCPFWGWANITPFIETLSGSTNTAKSKLTWSGILNKLTFHCGFSTKTYSEKAPAISALIVGVYPSGILLKVTGLTNTLCPTSKPSTPLPILSIIPHISCPNWFPGKIPTLSPSRV